jgi:hemerythrin-like domain-containing protein
MPHAHKGTPTEILKIEHEVILKVLGSFENILRRVEGGTPPDPELIDRTVAFFRGFADTCHHAKEEALLFPAMEEAGLSAEGGPVEVMLEEHEQGRAYIQGIVDAMAMVPGNADEGRKRLLNNGWAYIQMLQAHIHKENEILFPLADRVIPPDRMHALIHAFEDAEAGMGEGAHERFLMLAEEIAKRAGV